jgi:lysophospholipase L1-like esterase
VLDLAGRAGARVILVTVVSNLYEFPLRRAQWDAPQKPARWVMPYRRGIELYRAGRFAEALAAFKESRDAYPFGRAPSELNERLRELAQGRPHVHLVDFERTLDRAGLEEGIGCNFFGDETYCDQFHPNARTHRLIAEALLRTLEGLRGGGSPRP